MTGINILAFGKSLLPGKGLKLFGIKIWRTHAIFQKNQKAPSLKNHEVRSGKRGNKIKLAQREKTISEGMTSHSIVAKLHLGGLRSRRILPRGPLDYLDSQEPLIFVAM